MNNASAYVNYQETRLRIREGLTKLKRFQRAAGTCEAACRAW